MSCVKRVFVLMDDDEQEEMEVLERGMGTENSSECKMREVGGRVRVCWDLWGWVARAHREKGGGW